jgi:hypothetical protein
MVLLSVRGMSRTNDSITHPLTCITRSQPSCPLSVRHMCAPRYSSIMSTLFMVCPANLPSLATYSLKVMLFALNASPFLGRLANIALAIVVATRPLAITVLTLMVQGKYSPLLRLTLYTVTFTFSKCIFVCVFGTGVFHDPLVAGGF